jgi:hypothetical protein
LFLTRSSNATCSALASALLAAFAKAEAEQVLQGRGLGRCQLFRQTAFIIGQYLPIVLSGQIMTARRAFDRKNLT